MIKSTPLENESLPAIIRKSFAAKNQALFNNAAQSWNHAFYCTDLNTKLNKN